jgi:hypothetical protein
MRKLKKEKKTNKNQKKLLLKETITLLGPHEA